MPWLRHHFYCEGCDGTWLVEAEVAITADCPFCSARDLLPYRSDGRAAVTAPQLLMLKSRKTKPRRETRPSSQRPMRIRAGAKAASS